MISIKVILISVVCLFSSFTIANEDDYFVIYPNSKTALLYQGVGYSYLDYYLENKKTYGDKEYSVAVRKYSWRAADTSYYRMDSVNVYHFGKKDLKESLVIPRKPKLNDKWYESDSSWVYTVIKTDQKFSTPIKEFQNCVLVECKQLSNRDKEKEGTYFLYYSKSIGYVGNVDDKGKILTYLKERIDNVKEGTTIKAN